MNFEAALGLLFFGVLDYSLEGKKVYKFKSKKSMAIKI